MGVGGIIGSIGSVDYLITSTDGTQAGVDSAVANLKRVEDQSNQTTLGLAKIAAAFATLTAMSQTAITASDRVISLERATGRAAITQGVSTRTMFEYVQSLSNATDSQEEVGATMEYLTRSGVKWGDQLTSIYHTMDTLGDAVGQTSTQIAQELIPVFQALGMQIQDISKYTDALAYASQHTLFDIGTWAFMIKRNGEAISEYKIGIEETIAVVARMNELGIPQRKIMTIINEAFKDMGANAAIVKKGEEELLEVQEKLNKAQEDGSKSTRNYLEDMMYAGRDVSKMRDLTMAYNRKTREDSEEEAVILKEKAAIQAKIDAAKNAPKPDFFTSLSKADERLTVASLKAETEKYKGPVVKGAAEQYAAVGGMYTGTEKATHDMDVNMQNTLGKNIGADTAAGLVYLRNVSGAITVMSTMLALIKGFSATTAVATTATAAGSLNPIIAGLGFGMLGVAAMEATGVTGFQYDLSGGKEGSPGFFEKAGSNFRTLADNKGLDAGGMSEREFFAYYNSSAVDQTDKDRWTQTGRITVADKQKYSGRIKGYYAEGGVVPGAVGAPQLAIVHGGETITPAGRSGLSVSIGVVNLSRDYPFREMMRDIENYQSTKRKQSGVRTAT